LILNIAFIKKHGFLESSILKFILLNF